MKSWIYILLALFIASAFYTPANAQSDDDFARAFGADSETWVGQSDTTEQLYVEESLPTKKVELCEGHRIVTDPETGKTYLKFDNYYKMAKCILTGDLMGMILIDITKVVGAGSKVIFDK